VASILVTRLRFMGQKPSQASTDDCVIVRDKNSYRNHTQSLIAFVAILLVAESPREYHERGIFGTEPGESIQPVRPSPSFLENLL
jgi:hypothetical protein